MSQVAQPTMSTRSQLRAHWIAAVSALLALLATIAVTLVLVMDNGSSTVSSSTAKPHAAVRSDGGPNESTVAASIASTPSAGPDESNIAASIARRPSIGGPRMTPMGPGGSAGAAAVSGR